VPVPPNTEGAGSFAAQSNVGQGRICWRITVTGLTDVTAAHIHYRTGPKAQAIAVPLVLPTSFAAPTKGCSDAPRALIRQILRHPGLFYVNVHTTTSPTGRSRGCSGRRPSASATTRCVLWTRARLSRALVISVP
jgi:hypothetical protein